MEVSCDPDYSLEVVPFEGLTRGDTYEFPFRSEETSDTEITDDTVWTGRDLSAGTFAVTVRIGSTEGELWADAIATIDDTDAATGHYTLRLEDTSSAVQGYQYWFDVEYTDGDDIETLVIGYFTFDPDVTHG